MSATYRHTQIGLVTLTCFVIAFAFTAWLGPRAGWEPVLLFALAILLVGAISFSSMTVEVNGGAVTCRLGPGWIRRRIALQDIRQVDPVRNRWYYGWGIRWGPRGWLWNVSGLDAVELTLASGKIFRIGTDQPEELAAALRQASAWAKS